MTQHSQNGEGVERARARRDAKDASGALYVDSSIYVGMEACLVRSGKTVAHVVKYADAVEIAEAIQSLTREPATADVEQIRAAGERLLLAMTTRALRGRDHVPSMRDEQDAQRAFRTALSRTAPSSGHAMAEGERVERAGRALHAHEESWYDYDWGYLPKEVQKTFLSQGKAVLDALATTQPTTNDAIPAGWKLVPVDLTYEPTMREAAWKHIDNKLFHGLEAQLKAMWEAMLSAAPSAPATSDSLPGRGEVEAEPVAWMHTLHMEGGQTIERILEWDGVDEDKPERNGFGVVGRDYSKEYTVTVDPLFRVRSAHAEAIRGGGDGGEGA